ncbi:YciI family protein [Actinosynnema sp. CS-041913]|uniref:YciI family protein n=1 Tax=Actinosynnema sp. CS-041913 TaxID=3239917 RepID=UPI003D8A8B29
MKYLILIYGNPESRAIWDGLPAEQRAAGLDAYAQLDDDLADTGELVVSEALADPSLTKRLVVRDGQAITTDGPFAEAKELLAGFYLVDCDTLERAVEIAWRIPEAPYGLVEVRPVMSLGDFGL